MDFGKVYGSIDPKEEAQWFEHEDGGSFLIAPANNVKQQELLQSSFTVKELMSLESEGHTGTDDTAKHMLDKIRRITAEAILLDWKDVTHKDTEVKYTVEKALTYLGSYQVFMDWIADKAQEVANNRHLETAEKGKK